MPTQSPPELPDYSAYTEAELLDIVSRIDPRRAGDNFLRLKTALEARGYAVEVHEFGAVTVSLSPTAFRRSLDVQTRFGFGQSRGPIGWMEPSRNDFRLVGTGRVRVDNATLQLTGRRLSLLFGVPLMTHVSLDRERIVNPESCGSAVRFEYDDGGSRPKGVTLHLEDSATAQHLVALLPQTRTHEFRPKLEAELAFDQRVLARSPRVPITIALVALNVLVFMVMTVAGVSLLRPTGSAEIAWGADFGPYTTDGDWWRLLTSTFLHLGVVHLLFNMWALSAVGPLVERLYGSVTFLLMYVLCGVISSLASVAWAPDATSLGASGAIFGVYGLLLAALANGRGMIPSSVIAPLRNSTIVFALYALASGLFVSGIDNAAHLTGLAAGLALGALQAPLLNHDRILPNVNWRQGLTLLAGAFIIAAGGFFAQHRAAQLQGDGLFWRTQHWMTRREDVADRESRRIFRLASEHKIDDAGLARAMESRVLPFWREADQRMAGLRLPSESTLSSAAQMLASVTNSRKTAYELCVAGARTHDETQVRLCVNELARGDRIIAQYRSQASDARQPAD